MPCLRARFMSARKTMLLFGPARAVALRREAPEPSPSLKTESVNVIASCFGSGPAGDCKAAHIVGPAGPDGLPWPADRITQTQTRSAFGTECPCRCAPPDVRAAVAEYCRPDRYKSTPEGSRSRTGRMQRARARGRIRSRRRAAGRIQPSSRSARMVRVRTKIPRMLVQNRTAPSTGTKRSVEPVQRGS